MTIADNSSMASHLYNISALSGIPVSCTSNANLNQSHVVYPRDLLQFSEQAFLEELAAQQVVRVEGVKK